MKRQDIIITGIQAWDIGIGSNCINIAKEFSNKNRVLYVNPALDRRTYYKESASEKVRLRVECIKGQRDPLEKVSENLWVLNPPVLIESINSLPSFLFKLLNRRNCKKISREISKAVALLNFENYILFSDSDMFRSFYLKEYLQPSSFIYYTRDNLMTVPYWKKHGQKHEAQIMGKADVVVANSPYLTEKARRYNPNSFYVGQGCEIADFLPRSEENILVKTHKIIGKTVGYVGLLSIRRLSIETIEYIAKTKTDWNVVLVGPEEDCFASSILHQLSNVHFLGSVAPTELGKYVRAFDVCINPQIINDLTKGNYPRKIDEYLGAGKPVVASYTPTMEVFKEYCFLAKQEQDYPVMIQQAFEQNNAQEMERKIRFASTHSWSNSVALIMKAIHTNNKITTL